MEDIFNFFIKFGWEGILLIVVCMLLYFLSVWLGKKLSNDMSTGLERVGESLVGTIKEQNVELTKTIVDQQNKLVNHLISKDSKTYENHNIMLNKRIELADDINMALKDIMYVHNAQRAFIIELHNSYENLSGVPFAKYSVTYEWFEKGLMPLANKCMGLPFSQIAKIISDIMQSETQQKIYSDLIKMEEENPSLFALVKDTRTKAIVYNAMYDRHNQLIGCLGLEYQTTLEEGHLNLDQLKIQTAELTSILNIRYKYSKNSENEN